MAPESKPVHDPLGVIWRGIHWEWPNPKGVGLQKVMPQEHITGMLKAVEDGHRAWAGMLQHGLRSTNFCRFEFPRAWGGKGREGSSRAEVQVEPPAVSTSVSMLQDAAPANVMENGGREVETGFGFLKEFGMPEVHSGGAVTREELGRAAWTFLHTLAAQYPEKPTRQQKRDVTELTLLQMSIMTRLYPCKTCAGHFKEVLKAYPVKADSGVELAQWMCQIHNVVNRSLGKPQFPCQRVDARWGGLHCDEGACDLEGRLLYK